MASNLKGGVVWWLDSFFPEVLLFGLPSFYALRLDDDLIRGLVCAISCKRA